MEVCRLEVTSKLEIEVKMRRLDSLRFKMLKPVDSNLGQSLTVMIEI